jgi:hypothetical protein
VPADSLARHSETNVLIGIIFCRVTQLLTLARCDFQQLLNTDQQSSTQERSVKTYWVSSDEPLPIPHRLIPD